MKLEKGLLSPEVVNQVLDVILGKTDLRVAPRGIASLFLQEDGKKIVAGMTRFDQ